MMDLETLSSGFALSLQARMLGEFFEPRPEGNISLSCLRSVLPPAVAGQCGNFAETRTWNCKRIGTSAIR